MSRRQPMSRFGTPVEFRPPIVETSQWFAMWQVHTVAVLPTRTVTSFAGWMFTLESTARDIQRTLPKHLFLTFQTGQRIS